MNFNEFLNQKSEIELKEMENFMPKETKHTDENQEKLNLGNLRKSDFVDDAENEGDYFYEEEQESEEVTQKVLTNEITNKNSFAYSDEEIQEWEQIYEQLGSFRAVSKYIRDRNGGEGPSAPTITKQLKEKFEGEGRYFDEWVKQHSLGYSDEEIQEWEQIYEQLGSFRAVSKYIRDRTGGKGPSSNTVSKRLKEKFEQEERLFSEWVKQHSLGYSDEEIQEWEQLYKQFGSFRAVSKYIRDKNGGKGPNGALVLYRLKKKFKREGRDFDEWAEKFSKYEEILSKKHYTDKDLQEWEQLYEKFGSFSTISKYLKEYNGGDSPVTSTIILRLKEKFDRERRDFDDWVIEFFSPTSDIASNIGRFVHYILEVIFIEYNYLEKGLTTFSEVTQNFSGTKSIIDNSIVTPFKPVKLINIDYTIASDMRKILEKCFRKYQGPEKKLIIVVFLSDKKITLPTDIHIPNREMVIIFNAKEFADYIRYSEKYLEKYKYTRYLAKKAFYDNEAYVELEELSKNARSKLVRLKEKHLLSQKDFEHYLSSNGLIHLIE